jgi:hypothetical protein
MHQGIRHIPEGGTATPLPTLAQNGTLTTATARNQWKWNTMSASKGKNESGNAASATAADGHRCRMAQTWPIENP